MDEDRFDKLMEEWVAREEAQAPQLTPPQGHRDRVAARRRPRYAFGWWSLAAAGILLTGILFRLFVVPGDPEPEDGYLQLVAGIGGEALVHRGPRLEPARGAKGTKGPKGSKGAKGPQAALPGDFTLHLHHRKQGGKEILARDAIGLDRLRLQPGDLFRLGVRTGTPRHLHLYLMNARRDLVRLFPNPAWSPATNPLAPNRSHYLPARPGWLRIGGERGQGGLYAVLSPDPLTRLDELYRAYGKVSADAGKAQALKRFVDRLRLLARGGSGGRTAVAAIPFNRP